MDRYVNRMTAIRQTSRFSAIAALLAGLLLVGGCSKKVDEPAAKASEPATKTAGAPVCIDATVAYYYRYNDASPDQSDIAYIEAMPAANRCVIASQKRAPVYPDDAISGDVTAGKMKIDKPLKDTAHISASVATVAVYYKLEGSPPTSHTLLAVEDLSSVQRDINTASVFLGTTRPACGACAEFKCDSGTCCKRPPCP